MLSFFKNLADRVSGAPVDWDELEAALVAADFGPKFAASVVARAKERVGLFTGSDGTALVKAEVARILGVEPPTPIAKPLHVILVVGVNGAGKTTSAAKLARYHQSRGLRPRLAAADTFRAAAVEQLQLWGSRIGAPVTAGAYGADPSSIAFTACKDAASSGENLLVIDTAGRQHTKSNLMNELAKVGRVLKKIDPAYPHETLLAIDANTGSNALAQAKEFGKIFDLTGLVAAKFDGSGLGGALIAIQQECGLPCRWVGLGESIGDLRPFSPDLYLEKLFR